MEGVATVSWGLNSKGEARRAGRYLGWDPHAKLTLRDAITDLVRQETGAHTIRKTG